MKTTGLAAVTGQLCVPNLHRAYCYEVEKFKIVVEKSLDADISVDPVHVLCGL